MADSLFDDLAALLTAPTGASINVGIMEGGAYALLQLEGEEENHLVIPLDGLAAAAASAHVHRHAMNDNPWGPSGPWEDDHGREWWFLGEVR